MIILNDLRAALHHLEMIIRLAVLIAVPIGLGAVTVVWSLLVILREARKLPMTEAKASPNERPWPQS